MLNQVIVGFVVLVVAAFALRWQYGRVMGTVTDPNSDAHRAFPVTTPIIRELCPGGGSDCLLLPTPDIDDYY
jgi:hypothetical protein